MISVHEQAGKGHNIVLIRGTEHLIGNTLHLSPGPLVYIASSATGKIQELVCLPCKSADGTIVIYRML